jgi:hypothetical protein
MKMMIGFQVGLRKRILNSRFMGITTFTRDNDQPPLWWCYKTRKWVTSTLDLPEGGSTHASCRSYKAFERHLKKHVAELEGYEVVLESRFHGYNITAQVWK